LIDVIVYGVAAGIVGTALGGVIAAVSGRKDGVVGILFAIAGGIMLAIVCFDLVPEAAEGGISGLLCSLIAGVLLVTALDGALNLKKKDTDEINGKMKRTGIVMMLAIALHNLPEGLVIGSSETFGRGVITAVLIGLHNIPEGIAVAAPLISGGMKKWKAVLISGATGIPTLIGAIVGFYTGLRFPVFVFVSLGIAAGAMLAVVFSDMLPEAQKLNDKKSTGYATVLSVIAGAAFILFTNGL